MVFQEAGERFLANLIAMVLDETFISTRVDSLDGDQNRLKKIGLSTDRENVLNRDQRFSSKPSAVTQDPTTQMVLG